MIWPFGKKKEEPIEPKPAPLPEAKRECFCGRKDVVAQLGLQWLCEFHNKLYTYHKPAFEDEQNKFKEKYCACFKYAQSFGPDGRCKTCGKINQEVKKELDEFHG